MIPNGQPKQLATYWRMPSNTRLRKTSIDIAVQPLSLYVRIDITDHGEGIPSEEWNDIFKRFYRGKNVKGKEGAGLGLYLTSLILSKQGGYIMVNSRSGRILHVLSVLTKLLEPSFGL